MIQQASPLSDSAAVSYSVATDVDIHAATLVDWVEQYQQITPGFFEGSLHQVRFDTVQVFRESTSQAIHQTGQAWDNALCLATAISASGPVRWRGTSLAIHDVACFRGSDEIDVVTPQNCELIAVAVDEAEFERFAEEVDGYKIVGQLNAREISRTSPQTQARLMKFLVDTLMTVSTNAAILQSPEASKLLRESIYAELVATLTADLDLPSVAISGGRSALVARARDYLHDRPNDVVSVADICRVLQISRRTLQYAFQDVVGMNPVAYLRALRLNGVRRHLKTGKIGNGILDVAAHWGFWHPSHFRNDYKQMFGELPSETLKRFSNITSLSQ